ncbi:MAG: transcription-repair coupling factor, partial [Halioglobus sp.]|nr:transcription-repair coupling factor [Halioglobus sp.]
MFKALVDSTPWPGKAGSRTAIGPTSGCADALCIAELARERLLVVIASDTASALALERELPFFLEHPTEILHFPDWETLPYDNFSPHQDIVSERLHTLYRLAALRTGILIVPVSTLMHRLAPSDYVTGASLVLKEGQQLDSTQFCSNLERNGYVNVATVYEHGEFAQRGSLLDVFPMGSPLPFRIDLLDDEVDTLRTFDPQTQLTVEKVTAVNLLPAREYPLNRGAIEQFKMRWYEAFDSDPDQCPTFTEVSAGRSPGGCEYYLPLFFDACASLFDYLPSDSAIIATGDHHASAQQFWQEANARFTEYGIDPRRPLLPPTRCFLPVEELYQQLGRFAVLELRHKAEARVHCETPVLPPPDLGGEG